MKFLKLYDLKNGEVTALPNIREAKLSRKKKRIYRKAYLIVFTAFEILISITAGLITYQAIVDELAEIRGEYTIGSEFFLILLVSMATFLILEKLGDMVWKKKKSRR